MEMEMDMAMQEATMQAEAEMAEMLSAEML